MVEVSHISAMSTKDFLDISETKLKHFNEGNKTLRCSDGNSTEVIIVLLLRNLISPCCITMLYLWLCILGMLSYMFFMLNIIQSV